MIDLESTPTWAKGLLRTFGSEIFRRAWRDGLPVELILAVIWTESGGNPKAQRCEFQEAGEKDGRATLVSRWRYPVLVREWARKLNCTYETEYIGQATGWGLMQIQGATARELGFVDWFPRLCEPEVNLAYACQYLRNQMAIWGTSPEDAYAAYNGGNSQRGVNGMYRNQRNVDRFMAYYRELT